MAAKYKHDILFNYEENGLARMGRNINAAKTNTAGLSRSTKGLNKEMGGLATRFVGLQAVLSYAQRGFQMMSEYLKDSIQDYRDFEMAIAEVSTILGVQGMEILPELESGVVSLSLTFGKATGDMSKGLYDVLSAAFSTQEAIALLGTSSQAAIAGLADIRESVDIFTTVLNTYGMSAYEATAVSDTLFQSVVRGKFQFKDLESALGYVVPIAAQAGLAFDELMAALSTATRHGLHLDMASRGLALAIQGIINPSAKAAKAALKYGIAMDSLTLRIHGLEGFFRMLNDKTKIYGNTILSELIPNMRSLRVAMVLAGDEGVMGLAEDMMKLEDATGRTEEALGKIMETSQFVANQIEQEWEKTQREVGKGFDEIALAAKGSLNTIAADWRVLLPIIGGYFMGVQLGQKQQLANFKAQKEIQYRIIGGEEYRLHNIKSYLSLQEEITEQSKLVSKLIAGGHDYKLAYDFLLVLNEQATNLQDEFNRAFGEPILGGVRNLQEMETTLTDIEADVVNLVDLIEKPISVGWKSYTQAFEGTLKLTLAQKKAEQARVDTTYDVNMAMKSSTYIWKTNNAEVQDAVKFLREYEKTQEGAKKSTDALNRAMKLLHIQSLEIQLKGMMRRRGLTREEEKQLKRIQIEQAKLNIERMKSEVAANKGTDEVYEEKKKFIEDYISALKHEEYVVKYTLTNEIKELETQIVRETELLAQRRSEWDLTIQNIMDKSDELIDYLAELKLDEVLTAQFKDIDIDISDILEGVILTKEKHGGTVASEYKTMLDEGDTGYSAPAGIQGMSARDQSASITEEAWSEVYRRLHENKVSYKGGIDYVPKDTIAKIHQGEAVIPASRNRQGTSKVVNITNNIHAVINNEMDVDTLAAKLAEAEESHAMRGGRTTYRVV